MCDPTVLAIGSTVAGLAGSAVSSIQQSNAADQQKKAYDDWAQQQHANRVAAAAKDEQDRQMASTAQQQGLQDVSAKSQGDAQTAEQTRLNSYLQGQQPASTETNAPTASSDASLGGAAATTRFSNDLSAKLDKASADSKQRIAALATVGSYGGSFGGLDNTVSKAFSNAGGGIDMANDFRKGDMAVYGTQQAVNPLQYTYNPGPLPALSSAALQYGTQGIGKMLAGGVK